MSNSELQDLEALTYHKDLHSTSAHALFKCLTNVVLGTQHATSKRNMGHDNRL
jgi:hypothetical protein